MSSNEDPFTAFVKVLRTCIFFLAKNIFLTIANIICLVLFLAAIIPPWRLIGFCLSRDSHEAFEDMNYFRECALRNFCITLMDMFGLPFYLIGIVQPTRFDISICAIAAACTPAKYRSEYPNTSVRALLVYNACFGFIDLIGIAAFVCVFFVPWPTDVFKQLRHQYNLYLSERKSYLEQAGQSYEVKINTIYLRPHFQCKCALICVGILLRTIFEIITFAVLLIALLVPTRTVTGLRCIGNMFYIRLSSSIQLDQIEDNVNISFSGTFLTISFTALLDVITLPAAILVFLSTPFRISKFIKALKLKAGKGLWASIWPFRSNIVDPRTNGYIDGTFWDKLASIRSHSYPDSLGNLQVGHLNRHLYQHLHYNIDLRVLIWQQAMLVVLDVFIVPFYLLALFGIVHTIPFLSDIRKHWKKTIPPMNVPIATSAVPTAVTMGDVPSLPSVGTRTGTNTTLTQMGNINNPLVAWTETETERYDMFMNDFGYNWLLRVDAFYHGIMTIIDILFLPPLLICGVFCWRSRKVVSALRQGFNNEARKAILYAVWLVFTDIMLLPLLLVVLSPLGWMFQRAKPLSRQLCHRATGTLAQQQQQQEEQQQRQQQQQEEKEEAFSLTIERRTERPRMKQEPPRMLEFEENEFEEDEDAQSITLAQQLHHEAKQDEEARNRRSLATRDLHFSATPIDQVVVALEILSMDTVEWHCLIIRQFLLLLLDVIVLPCTVIVYLARWRWNDLKQDVALEPITKEGKELARRIQQNLISSEIYAKTIDVDSTIRYHIWVFANTFVVLHDILLVVGIGSVLFCSIYRTRRYIAIVHRVVVSKKLVAREIVWRQLLWQQFFNLFVDMFGFCIGTLTCVISPHRIPFLCKIFYEAYVNRTTPMIQPPIYITKNNTYDGTTTTTNNEQTGVEMKVMETTQAGRYRASNDTKTMENNDIDLEKGQILNVMYYTDEGRPKLWPAWDGIHYLEEYADGYWLKYIVLQFMNGIIDLPFIFASLPVILTLYRIDKLLLPMYYNRKMSIWNKRLLPFKQFVMIVLDLLCFPFFVIVIGTLQ